MVVVQVHCATRDLASHKNVRIIETESNTGRENRDATDAGADALRSRCMYCRLSHSDDKHVGRTVGEGWTTVPSPTDLRQVGQSSVWGI